MPENFIFCGIEIPEDLVDEDERKYHCKDVKLLKKTLNDYKYEIGLEPNRGTRITNKFFDWLENKIEITKTQVVNKQIMENNVGELIKVAGKKGDEPGEFQGPNIIRYYRSKLYVSEVYRPGIQVFDEDLNFEFKIPIRFTVTDFNIISEDRIAVSTLIQDKLEADYIFCIYIYDQEGIEAEEDRIIYSTEKKFSMMNTISFGLYRRSYFLIAFDWIDRIERYYKSGRLVWTKNLLGEKRARTRREKHSKRVFGVYPVETAYKSITLDRHGNVYILGGDFSENISRDVYVMSINGHHLTTFTLPEASRTIHIDRKNFLYSRSEDGKTIKKYSLEYFYE